MRFFIADSFNDSLAKLTGDEQKAVKTTAFDLQMDPANPGMQFHRLTNAKDPNFWSARVSRDIRIIVHKTSADFLLCYVDHHDDAYDWASRRKLQTHPKTGAAQLVEIRETVKEIVIPTYVEEQRPKPAAPPLFEHLSEETLLSYGIPEDWLEDVKAATEASLFDVADHLPGEAAEALLELATGGTPKPPVAIAASEDSFSHPDAARRFRIVDNADELKLALDAPWERWTVFLHPRQQSVIDADYNGPARVAGSAGTGKTVVALHRAARLVSSHLEHRVLLTTFSQPLAAMLRRKIDLLLSNKTESDCLLVEALPDLAKRLFHEIRGEDAKLASRDLLREVLERASAVTSAQSFSMPFLMAEWNDVVDAWQITDWDSYRTVPRLGRKTRVGEAQRRALWTIFETVRDDLEHRGLQTPASLYAIVTETYEDCESQPFDFAVVDEAQDIGVAELRFLAAVVGDKPNGLFFAGDLGQRIFQPPFSWKALGVDVRGRSKTLRLNYRTSHQIRSQADRLLPSELADVDGNGESRKGTISAFDGPAPDVRLFDSEQEELEYVAQFLRQTAADGIPPAAIGIIVRSLDEFGRASEAAKLAQMPINLEPRERDGTSATLVTMHTAKGLEFRVVVVMACDDEVVPLQERIESVGDEADLEDVYSTERHLLYVACTRARDRLLVTGVAPGSEFLEDLTDK